MRRFASEIYAAVKSGRLLEPFDAPMVKEACPGWSDSTYRAFLNQHAVGNPSGTTELFEVVQRGLYELKRPLPTNRQRASRTVSKPRRAGRITDRREHRR
jgi:hypothetical protein